MPGPAVYVAAVVVGIVAGVAFKEFVYDPHLAPKIEAWSQTYFAYRSRRRHAHSNSHSSDDIDSHDAEHKQSVELERLAEHELQDLNHGNLRHRNTQHSKDHLVETLENSSLLISFEPLSLPRAHPPLLLPSNHTASQNDELPIGRLPTPVSDQPPSVSTRDSSPDQRTPSPPVRSATRSPCVHLGSQPTRSPDNVHMLTPRRSGSTSSESGLGLVAEPHTGSEYDFVLRPSPPENTAVPEPDAATPFPDARAATHFSDARSEASLDFTSSEADISDAGLSFVTDTDLELISSHASSDFEHFRHDVDSPQVPQVHMPSDPGSEDWEHLSDIGMRNVPRS